MLGERFVDRLFNVAFSEAFQPVAQFLDDHAEFRRFAQFLGLSFSPLRSACFRYIGGFPLQAVLFNAGIAEHLNGLCHRTDLTAAS